MTDDTEGSMVVDCIEEETEGQTTILDLPAEVLANIFAHTEDKDMLRHTCLWFREVFDESQWLEVKNTARKCTKVLQGFKDRVQPQGFAAFVDYYPGSEPLAYLEDLLRVLDASTYVFLLWRVIPPPPREMLLGLQSAVEDASRWRFFTLGKSRLLLIFDQAVQYLSACFADPRLHLNSTLLLWTVSELMKCLKITETTLMEAEDWNVIRYQLANDEYIVGPGILPAVVTEEGGPLDGVCLVRALAALGLQRVDRYLRPSDVVSAEVQGVWPHFDIFIFGNNQISVRELSVLTLDKQISQLDGLISVPLGGLRFILRGRVSDQDSSTPSRTLTGVDVEDSFMLTFELPGFPADA